MPSHSKAQYKFFEIASYNKEFAEARNLDQAQAREWHDEDKKKREEDPEWYEKLPEKAEKKKEKDDDKDKDKKDDKKDKSKKSEVSTESNLPSTLRW